MRWRIGRRQRCGVAVQFRSLDADLPAGDGRVGPFVTARTKKNNEIFDRISVFHSSIEKSIAHKYQVKRMESSLSLDSSFDSLKHFEMIS